MGKKIFGINVKDLVFLGKGVEGRVFLTPDGNVLKAYSHGSLCKREYKVLKRVEGKKYFPKIIECKGQFMLREYVKGTPIREYIQENGLSRKLSLNLIEFAEELEKLQIRLDGLSKHVFIQEDESIKVVDPRRKKIYMYKSLLLTLKKLEVLEDFLKILEEERPDLASSWSKFISRLTKDRQKKTSKPSLLKQSIETPDVDSTSDGKSALPEQSTEVSDVDSAPDGKSALPEQSTEASGVDSTSAGEPALQKQSIKTSDVDSTLPKKKSSSTRWKRIPYRI